MIDIQVHIFDIPSNAVVHKIGLTHTISSIDEWNGYLLIGSSLIHVVDTRNHSSQWHRTVVVDMEERDNIKVDKHRVMIKFFLLLFTHYRIQVTTLGCSIKTQESL